MKLQKLKPLLKQLIESGDREKLKLAAVFDTAHREIDWKSTNYKTWRKFCKECVPLPYTEVYRLMSTVQKSSLWFTPLETAKVVSAIGWTRFETGTQLCNTKKVTVNEFIDWYEDVNVDQRTATPKPDNGLETFNFQLDKENAEALTTLLLERGMRITNASRVNASVAMARLVADVRKNS